MFITSNNTSLAIKFCSIPLRRYRNTEICNYIFCTSSGQCGEGEEGGYGGWGGGLDIVLSTNIGLSFVKIRRLVRLSLFEFNIFLCCTYIQVQLKYTSIFFYISRQSISVKYCSNAMRMFLKLYCGFLCFQQKYITAALSLTRSRCEFIYTTQLCSSALHYYTECCDAYV